MINAITFTNRYGRSLRCVLAAPYLSSFAIQSITGLGPEKATINIHDIATADGGYFGSARFGTRNIVVNFLLTELNSTGGYSPIEKTRQLSYEFFAPKSKIRIVIETDNRMLAIEGYVETNEPSIFSQQESIQVSILCPGYYFKMIHEGSIEQTVRVYGAGLFEFPFSNESLTRKLIEFGTVSQLEHHQVYYDGDAENGFTLSIVFLGEDKPVTGKIYILNRPIGNSDLGDVGFIDAEPHHEEYEWTDTSLTQAYIEIDMSVLATKLTGLYGDHLYDLGNRIEICTKTGLKSAKFYVGNTGYNILGNVSHLEWLKIYPGYNEFTVESNAASAGHFQVNIDFECLYTGV